MRAPAALVGCPLVAGVVAGIALRGGPIETRVAIAIGWMLVALAFHRRLARAFAIAAPGAAFAIGAAIGGHAVRAADTPSLLAWYREAPADGRSHDDPVALAGTLRDDAAQSANSVTLTLHVSVVDGRHVRGAVRVSIAGTLAADAIGAGRAGGPVSMAALLREPIDFGDPGVASDRERLARQGI